VTTPSCKDIATKLVDYADGRLAAAESAEVAEHLGECAACRETVGALVKSLELAQAVWQAGEANLAGVAVSSKGKAGWHWRRVGAAAACIALLLGGTLIWCLARPARHEPDPGAVERTLAAIEQAVMRAGEAAQLLAVADMVAQQPGNADYARERFEYIAANYPDMDAGIQAKLRIQSFPERSYLQ